MDKGAEEGTAAGADRRAVDLVLGSATWRGTRTGRRPGRGRRAEVRPTTAPSARPPASPRRPAWWPPSATTSTSERSSAWASIPPASRASLAPPPGSSSPSWRTGRARSGRPGASRGRSTSGPSRRRTGGRVTSTWPRPRRSSSWSGSSTSGRWPRRPTLSADVFEPFVRQFPEATRRVVRVADVVFMNEEEAALLRATEQPWPPGDVVLKRGAAGAAYYHGSPAPASPISPICAPAPPTRAVETTGAGDLLAGAFLALRMRGVSPGRALDAAVRVASASVTDFGVDHPQLQHTIAGVRDTLLAGSRRDHLHLRQKPRTRPPTL